VRKGLMVATTDYGSQLIFQCVVNHFCLQTSSHNQ
jgi:hypothetical protein